MLETIHRTDFEACALALLAARNWALKSAGLLSMATAGACHGLLHGGFNTPSSCPKCNGFISRISTNELGRVVWLGMGRPPHAPATSPEQK